MVNDTKLFFILYFAWGRSDDTKRKMRVLLSSGGWATILRLAIVTSGETVALVTGWLVAILVTV